MHDLTVTCSGHPSQVLDSTSTPLACVPGDRDCVPQFSSDKSDTQTEVLHELNDLRFQIENRCGSEQVLTEDGVKDHVMGRAVCDEGDFGGCSARGACVGGGCLCPADFIGARCEHSVLENPEYLPEFHPEAKGWRCAQSILLHRHAIQVNIYR